jgi:hypothetical protein
LIDVDSPALSLSRARGLFEERCGVAGTAYDSLSSLLEGRVQ